MSCLWCRLRTKAIVFSRAVAVCGCAKTTTGRTLQWAGRWRLRPAQQQVFRPPPFLFPAEITPFSLLSSSPSRWHATCKVLVTAECAVNNGVGKSVFRPWPRFRYLDHASLSVPRDCSCFSPKYDHHRLPRETRVLSALHRGVNPYPVPVFYLLRLHADHCERIVFKAMRSYIYNSWLFS